MEETPLRQRENDAKRSAGPRPGKSAYRQVSCELLGEEVLLQELHARLARVHVDVYQSGRKVQR